MIALPTIRNTASYDVIVTSTDGKKHANIQVKTKLSPKSANFFPMGNRKVSKIEGDYYVLLRWLAKNERFEGFMLSGHEAHKEVQRMINLQNKKIKKGERKKTFPSVHIGGKHADKKAVESYRQRWENWKL
jgi:cobalamin biosynthesis Co2+ chelatase CbiK